MLKVIDWIIIFQIRLFLGSLFVAPGWLFLLFIYGFITFENLAWYWEVLIWIALVLMGGVVLYAVGFSVVGKNPWIESMVDNWRIEYPKRHISIKQNIRAVFNFLTVWIFFLGVFCLGMGVFFFNKMYVDGLSKWFYIFVYIFGLGGVSLLRQAYAFYQIAREKIAKESDLSTIGVETKATITHLDYDWSLQFNNQPVNYFVDITFSDASGTQYSTQISMPYDDASDLSSGDMINISYNPKEPLNLKVL